MFPSDNLKILVPTDFSVSSDYALEYAKALARVFQGSLYLTHVIETIERTDQWSYVYTPIEEVGAMVRKEVRDKLQKVADALEKEGIATHIVMMSGVPYIQIAKYAEQYGINVIVVATHGKSALEHMILGSTTERLVRTVQCPVLVVRSSPDAKNE